MSVQGRERKLLRDLQGMHSQAPLWALGLWGGGGEGAGGLPGPAHSDTGHKSAAPHYKFSSKAAITQ